MAKCACGKPLHYSDTFRRQMIDQLIEELGEYTTITSVRGGRYRVQRHYIALHGLKEAELPSLAERGIVDRL